MASRPLIFCVVANFTIMGAEKHHLLPNGCPAALPLRCHLYCMLLVATTAPAAVATAAAAIITGSAAASAAATVSRRYGLIPLLLPSSLLSPWTC